jgi:hypothetical protein
MKETWEPSLLGKEDEQETLPAHDRIESLAVTWVQGLGKAVVSNRYKW